MHYEWEETSQNRISLLLHVVILLNPPLSAKVEISDWLIRVFPVQTKVTVICKVCFQSGCHCIYDLSLASIQEMVLVSSVLYFARPCRSPNDIHNCRIANATLTTYYTQGYIRSSLLIHSVLHTCIDWPSGGQLMVRLVLVVKRDMVPMAVRITLYSVWHGETCQNGSKS